MAIVSRNGKSPVATQDDVLQSSKAIHDRLEQAIDGRFTKQIDRFDRTMEGELESLRKGLRKEFEERYEKRFWEELAKGMDAAERRHASVFAQQESLHEERIGQVKALYQERLDVLTKELSGREERHRQQVEEFQEQFELAKAQYRENLDSLAKELVGQQARQQEQQDERLEAIKAMYQDRFDAFQ